MLWTAWRISSFSDRRDRLSNVARELAAMPRPQLLELWHKMLGKMSERRREELLADLAALAPVVAALGGRDGVRESVRAFSDVSTWWP